MRATGDSARETACARRAGGQAAKALQKFAEPRKRVRIFAGGTRDPSIARVAFRGEQLVERRRLEEPTASLDGRAARLGGQPLLPELGGKAFLQDRAGLGARLAHELEEPPQEQASHRGVGRHRRRLLAQAEQEHPAQDREPRMRIPRQADHRSDASDHPGRGRPFFVDRHSSRKPHGGAEGSSLPWSALQNACSSAVVNLAAFRTRAMSSSIRTTMAPSVRSSRRGNRSRSGRAGNRRGGGDAPARPRALADLSRSSRRNRTFQTPWVKIVDFAVTAGRSRWSWPVLVGLIICHVRCRCKSVNSSFLTISIVIGVKNDANGQKSRRGRPAHETPGAPRGPELKPGPGQWLRSPKGGIFPARETTDVGCAGVHPALRPEGRMLGARASRPPWGTKSSTFARHAMPQQPS